MFCPIIWYSPRWPWLTDCGWWLCLLGKKEEKFLLTSEIWETERLRDSELSCRLDVGVGWPGPKVSAILYLPSCPVWRGRARWWEVAPGHCGGCFWAPAVILSDLTCPHQSFQDSPDMKISPLALLLLLSLSVHNANAQFGFDIFRPLQNLLKPVMRFFGGGPKFQDDGTQTPQATGNDKLFPDDCGRDEDKGTGKLCFPDGLLCQNSKLRAIM